MPSSAFTYNSDIPFETKGKKLLAHTLPENCVLESLPSRFLRVITCNKIESIKNLHDGQCIHALAYDGLIFILIPVYNIGRVEENVQVR